MGPTEVGFFGAVIAAQGLMTWALYRWGRHVARRQSERLWWRRAAWMPVAAFLLSTVGLLLTAFLLAESFEAARATNPASKAQRLGDGVSGAMIATATLIVPSGLLYLGSFALFALGSLRTSR